MNILTPSLSGGVFCLFKYLYYMKENRVIPHLTKLLNNLIFKDFNLDFKLTHKDNELFLHGDYLLILYIDPEVMNMSGNEYNPDSNKFLYDVEENIHDVLPYVGLTNLDVMIKFKFINEKEFSNKLSGMINGILPTLYNRIDDLPKLHNIEVGQRQDMAEFKVSFKFDGMLKMSQISGMYENINELLPTFDDVYMDFGAIE
jgi:hypothetical protein